MATTVAASSSSSADATKKSDIAPLTTADFTVPSESGRKIPSAKFIRSVEQFVGLHNPQHAEAIARELLMKYRYMEQALQRQSEALLAKIGDMERALEAIRMLQKQRAKAKEAEDPSECNLRTYFEVADTIHAQAIVPPTETVGLWLGANTVMECPLDEAEELLTNNVNTAQTARTTLLGDLRFLREQITTAEVNVARIHNYGVKKTQEAKGKREDV
ncbi:prefoldin subunit [Cystoisospora suis]|uniref:Prefoldin subunit 3 n=1 Tax=Cystoisospora suis TaxID=483139 RepID=A0A2C6LIE5_9APIC|nr:prefoldin subunit [Cystoisospora suis]